VAIWGASLARLGWYEHESVGNATRIEGLWGIKCGFATRIRGLVVWKS
jgi:hypothetical protein